MSVGGAACQFQVLADDSLIAVVPAWTDVSGADARSGLDVVVATDGGSEELPAAVQLIRHGKPQASEPSVDIERDANGKIIKLRIRNPDGTPAHELLDRLQKILQTESSKRRPSSEHHHKNGRHG